MFDLIRKIYKSFLGIWFVGDVIFFIALGTISGVMVKHGFLGFVLGLLVGVFTGVISCGKMATLIHMSDSLEIIARGKSNVKMQDSDEISDESYDLAKSSLDKEIVKKTVRIALLLLLLVGWVIMVIWMQHQ